MNWEAYYRAYQSFDLSVNIARVVAKAAYYLLEEFPTRLPQDLQAKVGFGEELFKGLLADLVRGEPGRPLYPVAQAVREASSYLDGQLGDAPGIIEPVLRSYLNAMLLGIPRPFLAFNQQVYVQQIMMAFAHLDAFIADSIRCICEVCPDVLKSSRKLDWSTIVSAGSWDQLFQTLIEQYVYQFGFQSAAERIRKMRSNLGLDIALHDHILLALEVGEMLRNLCVHNGGRVNQDFIDRTAKIQIKMDDETIPGSEWVPLVFFHPDISTGQQAPSLRAGDTVFLDEEIADGITKYAQIAAGELFVAVSVKFFGKAEKALPGVARQGQPEVDHPPAM